MNRNCITSLLATSMLLCTLAAANAQDAEPQKTVQPRENIGDQVPHSWGGLPDNVPARRQTVMPTPPVHDVPPRRATKPMPAAQQLQLQKEMSAARSRNLSHEDPDITKKSAAAAAANNAAIEGARKKAGKPAQKPDLAPPKQ